MQDRQNKDKNAWPAEVGSPPDNARQMSRCEAKELENARCKIAQLQTEKRMIEAQARETAEELLQRNMEMDDLERLFNGSVLHQDASQQGACMRPEKLREEVHADHSPCRDGKPGRD